MKRWISTYLSKCPFGTFCLCPLLDLYQFNNAMHFWFIFLAVFLAYVVVECCNSIKGHVHIFSICFRLLWLLKHFFLLNSCAACGVRKHYFTSWRVLFSGLKFLDIWEWQFNWEWLFFSLVNVWSAVNVVTCCWPFESMCRLLLFVDLVQCVSNGPVNGSIKSINHCIRRFCLKVWHMRGVCLMIWIHTALNICYILRTRQALHLILFKKNS